MLRNKFIIFACMLMAGFNANAGIDQSPTVQVTGWNSGGNANNVNLSANEFILGGCADAEWNERCHGTEDDEGAIVVQMAYKINDNGAYFCPAQIQFANQNHKQWIVVQFKFPDIETSSSSLIPTGEEFLSALNKLCQWVCKPGYMGDECQTPVAGYNEKIEPMDFSELKSNISLRTSGSSKINNAIPQCNTCVRHIGTSISLF